MRCATIRRVTGHAAKQTILAAQMSPGMINFLAGGLGGFPFWFFATPMDNLKKCGICLSHGYRIN